MTTTIPASRLRAMSVPNDQTMTMTILRRVVPFVLLLSALAFGQQSVPLSVDDAVRIAFDKSKTLHASLMKAQYADALSSEVHTFLLPSLKFNGTYARLSQVPPFSFTLPLPPTPVTFTLAPSIVDNYNLKLTLQQPLFTGWKIQSAANAAEYSAQAARQDYSKDRSDLVYRTRAAYWTLSKAIAIEHVVSEAVEQIRSHLKDVQNFFAQGIATNNDVLKVQVQLSEAQLRQIDAQNGVRLARISMNYTIGLPLGTAVELRSALQKESKTFPPLESLIEQASSRRPELRGMEYRVKAGEAGVTQAHAAWFPQIYLAGDYYYNKPNTRYQPILNAYKDSWDIAVSVSFDIWTWGAAWHQADQANAQLEQAKDGLGTLRDAVALDVTSNYLNLQRSTEQIAVAEQGVRQAEENERVTNSRFKQGLSTNTDLLDAENALLAARTNFTQALTDYELAAAGLERATGE